MTVVRGFANGDPWNFCNLGISKESPVIVAPTPADASANRLSLATTSI